MRYKATIAGRPRWCSECRLASYPRTVLVAEPRAALITLLVTKTPSSRAVIANGLFNAFRMHLRNLKQSPNNSVARSGANAETMVSRAVSEPDSHRAALDRRGQPS